MEAIIPRMKERRLGKTGLRVSEIGFGGWAIGGNAYGPVRDKDSLEALAAACDSGVNFFDTADIYGEGHSEELLGKFLKGRSRDSLTLATKCGWDFYSSSQKPASLLQGASEKTHPAGHRKNFDTGYIRFACEQSLKRLGTDVIDLFQLHNPSLELIQRGDLVSALEELKKEGKIRFIGISVHTEAEALAALEDSRVQAIQIIFNLLDQRMLERVLPEAEEKNAGVIVREALASGLLSGKYAPSHEFPKNDHRRRWASEKREADWQKIRLIQETLGSGTSPLLKTALEFTLAFGPVSTVIVGVKTRAQVLENVTASLKPVLSPEDIERLKELYAREEIFRKGLNPR
ncbi:MAG: aldo/keto reductase [Candidatus Omnitrophica bacterium]|nr:aldo/keto reductase [Candidatus Omnitrophota bacterium]